MEKYGKNYFQNEIFRFRARKTGKELAYLAKRLSPIDDFFVIGSASRRVGGG